MRDKHISATPASGRQRGSETTTFTGRQRFYSTQLIYQNQHKMPRFLLLLLVMALFFILSTQVYALNQIENGDFTSSETAGWTQSTKEFYDAGKTSLNFSSDNNSASYLTTNSLKLTLTISNGGSPNLLYYGKVNLSQSILTSQRSTQVNARLTSSYKEYVSNVDECQTTHSGRLYTADEPDIIFHSETNLMGGPFDTNWTPTTGLKVVNATLSANTTYNVELAFDLRAWRNRTVSVWLDGIRCNISPSGLTATEQIEPVGATSRGKCLLEWDDSSPGTNCFGLHSTSAYRVYHSYIGANGPWTQIATLTSSDGASYTVSPTEDVVWYAVSDVDSSSASGEESPLSIAACYRTAKLEITKVEMPKTHVTKGENGLPIKVYITNTGYTDATLDTLDLIFETPANYSIAAPIPSLPPTIHAGDSEVIAFYVNVLADSESGSDYIGAQLTGTNAKTTLSISDLVDYSVPSDKRGEWIIQDQPKLVLEQIIASETVYLDQIGVGVYLKVRNDGEATVKWDLWNGTEIIENISLGTYLNQSPDGIPDPSPPFLLAGGQTATVRFNIDVSPLSATGTAEVKAVIFYRDANNNDDYACYDPASTNWTIRAGVLQTYRGPPQFDPPYEEQSSSFNLGNFKVYAKGYNLQPMRDYRLRWYHLPSATQISQFTFTNNSGIALGSLPLGTDTSLLGNWSVRITRITNEIPLCETSFEVVEPASLSVELKLPASVTIGQTFVATMTFINSGGSRIDTASASALIIDNPIASYVSGPSPVMTTVPGKGSANLTWKYIATDTGSFSLTGRGYGVDSNDLRDLISDYDTSDPCDVQNPPQLNMLYVSLGQTVVFNNQQNISVNVGVSNTGEASAWIMATDLEFSLGDYYTTLASPSLPFLLQPGSPAVLNFLVNVAPTNAVGGDVTVTASYTAIDANWPDSTPVTKFLTATQTWNLRLPAGYCSAYLSMTPEQYTFNAGQIVYAEYANLTPGDSLRLLYMTANKEAADADPVDGQFQVVSSGTLQNSYQLPESITGLWKTELHAISGKSGTLKDKANPLGRQFFTIQNPGSISSTMSFVPDEVEEDDYVSLVMTISNNVASGSTIKDIIPSIPLNYLNSSGTLVPDSGPVPASATLPAGSTATFTWTFIADENTGADGYLQMIATATGKDGNLPDLDPQKATSSTCISSNQLRIYYRNLDYSPPLLDFGNMSCGASKLVVSGQVNNLGSTKLTHVTWSKGFFVSELLDEIHPNNLTLYPLSGFEVPIIAPKYTLASGVMQIPYNQPAGTYLATMTVFEDMMKPSYNGFLDVGEKSFRFTAKVIVDPCKVVYAEPDLVDLGDWKQGNTVATRTVTIRNGGNLKLENLKIQAPATDFTFYFPSSIGELDIYDSVTASISAFVDLTAADDDHYIDLKVWDDSDDDDNPDDGEASGTFQVHIGIGNQKMKFFPDDTLDMGIATPTFVVEKEFGIENIGDRTLNRLNFDRNNIVFVNVATPTLTITGDATEIEMTLPDLATNTTDSAMVVLFIPPGTPYGDYVGTATIFEDEDSDGIVGGENEAPEELTIKFYVPEFRAIRISDPIVSAGQLSKGDLASTTFEAKNIGNVPLLNLDWNKIDLYEPVIATHLFSVCYDFDPLGLQAPNQVFIATMHIEIPLDQADGTYYGEPAELFDFQNVASDPYAPFPVSCTIGTKYIRIEQDNLLINDAKPTLLSDAASFTLLNTGSLALQRPKAKATVLTSGGNEISATASAFILESNDIIVKYGWRLGSWTVQVPPGTPAGTYDGIMWAWNDADNDNVIDDIEASDSAQLSIIVVDKMLVGIASSSLYFGYVAPEATESLTFKVLNTGNVPIPATMPIRMEIATLTAAGPIIPAAKLQILSTPITGMTSPGEYITDATITIPAGQSQTLYEGLQRIYIDENDNKQYDDGEPNTTFVVSVRVGVKKIEVDDFDMGTFTHNSTAITGFTVKNTGPINLSKVRIGTPQSLTNGIDTLTPSFSTAGLFIAAGGTLNATATVGIPQYTSPGVYTSVLPQIAFEDDLSPYDPLPSPSKEASDTFMLTLTVATSPGLVITDVDPVFPVTVSLGQSVSVNVTYQNTGNVPLTDLTWEPMVMMAGSDGGNMTPTFDPVPLLTINPNDSITCSLVFTAAADQATGTYTAVQTLSSTLHPAASVNLPVEVLVISQTGPKDLEPGTIFQSVATETFSAGDDFIFSVYVGFDDLEPAASATIGFRQDKDDDTLATGMLYVTVDHLGNIVADNPAGAGGIAARIRSGSKTWYRLYLKFNSTLHADTESTYLILSNSSSTTGANVWFDGVQLEKANGRNRPTAYGEGKKIYSPNNRIDLEGKAQYSEW